MGIVLKRAVYNGYSSLLMHIITRNRSMLILYTLTQTSRLVYCTWTNSCRLSDSPLMEKQSIKALLDFATVIDA